MIRSSDAAPDPVTPDVLRRPLPDLPDPLALPRWTRRPGAAPLDAVIRPPGSKSLTNRAILLAALAEGESTITGALLGADDAERMIAAVRTLGATVEREDDGTLRVVGAGGRWRTPDAGVTLDLGNAGTATRFLCAAALCSPAPITIDGNDRMRARPIGELTELLARLGATVEHLGAPGCPPVRITAPPGGVTLTEPLEIGQTRSSQFVSALLLVGPFLAGGLTVRMTGEITSASYVRMTVELLDRVGADVRASDDMRVLRVLPGLDGFALDVEPDASGAAYWWAAGALLPGHRVGVSGLPPESNQGDAHLPELLGRMGAWVERDGSTVRVRGPRALEPIMADVSDLPDAAVALAVVCAFARGTSVLRGVRTLRVKECDRISALRSELAKIGAEVVERVNGDDDVMTVTGVNDRGGDAGRGAHADADVVFDTYDDHRMAMALSLIALRRGGVVIRDPGCVEKTYPGFFADLAAVYEG